MDVYLKNILQNINLNYSEVTIKTTYRNLYIRYMLMFHILLCIIYFEQIFSYNNLIIRDNLFYNPSFLLDIVDRDDFIPTSDTDYIRYKPPKMGTWDKKPNMITISPGGIYGFYTLGTCSYIRNNYNVSDYIFSGASAGSWNSLYMVLKNDKQFSKLIFDIETDNISSIFELEYTLKNRILESYKTSDFDLMRLFIGVTVLKGKKLKTSIYCDFEDLKDAIDCCIASSHIPFVTGGALKKYKDILSFDGGFSKYPYIRNVEPILHISPSIWGNNKNINCYESYLFNFKQQRHMIGELYENGYNDALKNKDVLDSILK